MQTDISSRVAIAAELAALFAAPNAVAEEDDGAFDAGSEYEAFLRDESEALFGFKDPLESSAKCNRCGRDRPQRR